MLQTMSLRIRQAKQLVETAGHSPRATIDGETQDETRSEPKAKKAETEVLVPITRAKPLPEHDPALAAIS